MLSESKKHEKLADRLVKILTKLSSGDKVCIKDLAEQFNCSERTISRDMARFEGALCLIKQGAYYSIDPKTVGKLNLKNLQHFAEISGVKQLYPALTGDYVANLLHPQTIAMLGAKGHSPENIAQFNALLDYLKPAIQHNQHVSFTYKGQLRTVQPYKIVNHQGSWYLAAVREHELRAYRLSRIQLTSHKTICESFKPEAAILQQLDNEENIWFGQDKMEVVLSVDAEVAMYFIQRNLLPEQRLLRHLDDGGILLSSTVMHKTQILPLVRYWIPHLKVISPESLKTQLKQSLSDYMEGV